MNSSPRRVSLVKLPRRFRALLASRLALRTSFKIAALLAMGAPALRAATYTYDANTATTGQQDGTGVWDTTTANFLDSTGTDVVYGNTFADSAVFGVGTATVTASTVTVSAVNANAMQINALGTGGTYTFTGGTITFGGTTPTITNNNFAGLDLRNGVGTTIGSTLAGTAGLTFTGAGSMALTGTNTFSGGVTLAGGVVRVATDAALGDAGNAITVTANSTLGANGAALALGRNIAINTGTKLTFDPQQSGLSGNAIPATAVLTSSGAISGAGALILGSNNRESLTILNGTNTHTGGTALVGTGRAVEGVGLSSGGNLSLEGNGSIGNTSQGVLETNGTFSRALGTGAGQVQWGGNIAGQGTAVNNGGFSAVGGALTVNIGGAGATLTSGSGGFTSGDLRLQDFNATAALTFVNPINLNGAARSISVLSTQPATMTGVLSSAGGVTKNGAGTLILSAANTYTGVTTVASGTLSTGTAGTLANGGTASSIGAGSNAPASLILTGGSILQYASTGAAQSTDHLFQLGTTAATTASLDASGTNPITFSNAGAITYGTTALTRTLTLTGTNTGANTFTPIIGDNGTGLVSLAKSGAGRWVLAGANTFTGGTTLSAGTLVAASTSAIGTSLTLSKLTITGTTSVYDIATDGTGDTANPISIGTGNIGTIASDVKTGSVGINHTLGTVVLSNVTLNVTKGPNVLSGSPSITLGTINLSSGGTATTTTLNPTSADLILAGAVSASNTPKTLDLDGTSQGNKATATIQGSTGNIITVIKSGTSTWEFDATNSYGGGTTISGGTLALGNTGAFGGGAVVNNAAIAFRNTAALTVANVISGTGTVTQTGTGTTNLTGANTYSGNTTVTAGALALGNTGSFGTSAVIDNAAVVFTNTTTAQTVGNVISGTGTVAQTGVGTTTLSGANSYSGGTSIGAVGSNVAGNTSTLLITNGSALGTGPVTLNGNGAAFSVLQLQGGITTPTTNTLTLVGSRNVSTGGPILDNVSGNNTFQGAILINGSGGNGANIQSDAGTLTLSGNLGSSDNGREYVFQGAGNIVVSGVISNSSTTPIIKNGTGTTTLTAANTYGPTSVAAGTLALGDGGTFGTGAVTNNATVAFSNATTALTVGNVISGTGAVIQSGAGTTTLTGANTFGGTTTINAGTLAASATTGKALGGTTGIAINAGTLTLGTTNQVNATAPITMGTATPTSGILSVAAGASQGSASTVVGGTPDGTTSVAGLGALTLNNTSTLTFSGASTTLVFGTFTANNNSVLNVTGYSNGTATPDGLNSGGANDDRLVFSNGGNTANNAAITSFAFNGNAAGFGVSEIALDGNFYEVAFSAAVPEPSTWVGGLLGLGVFGFAQRRRLSGWLGAVRQS